MTRFTWFVVLILAIVGCDGPSTRDTATERNSTPPNSRHFGHWVDSDDRTRPYTELLLLADGRGILVAKGEDDVLGVEFTVEQTEESGVLTCTPGEDSDCSLFTLTAVGRKLNLQGDDFDNTSFHQIAEAIPDSLVQEYFGD